MKLYSFLNEEMLPATVITTTSGLRKEVMHQPGPSLTGICVNVQTSKAGVAQMLLLPELYGMANSPNMKVPSNIGPDQAQSRAEVEQSYNV